MRFSIVIPARDEERRIGACLRSIEAAAQKYPAEVEVVVVINRCTDRTEEIARDGGAVIVREEAKNLSKIRNAGAAVARGEVLVTIDADSTMSPNFLEEVDGLLRTGRYIGGGTSFRLDRLSIGILLSSLWLLPLVLALRVAAGAFWLLRSDYEALGGFDEERLTGEDVEFALRLRRYGRKKGKRFKILWKAFIRTSARKFDRFGDFYLFWRPWLWLTVLTGRDKKAADRMWYDTPRD